MNASHQNYAANARSHHCQIRQALRNFAFGKNNKILDIDCGDGRITAEMALAIPYGSVVGLDSDPAFLELARVNFPPAHFPNLTFSLENARSISYESEFDVITSFATLHIIPDHSELLSVAIKALGPEGKSYGFFR